jgi:DNA-binding XRE family transcriptional regulator
MINSAFYCTYFCDNLIFNYICIKKSHKMHFGELIKAIKERREMLKVTQESLAELRTIKQFESGKGNPTLQTLQKIADLLGMELTLKLKNITPDI